MAKVTIKEAAKLAGVGRSTIDRQLREGGLSFTIEAGVRYIDLSELARVYPVTIAAVEASQNETVVGRSGTGVGTVETAENERVIERLETENRRLQDTIDDLRRERDRLIGVVERLLPAAPSSRLSESSPAQQVVGESLWDRLKRAARIVTGAGTS